MLENNQDFFINNNLPIPKEQDSGLYNFIIETISPIIKTCKGEDIIEPIINELNKQIRELSPFDREGNLKRLIFQNDSKINQRQVLIKYVELLITRISKNRDDISNIFDVKKKN